MDEQIDYLQFEPGTIVKLTGETLDIGVVYEVPLRGWRRWLYRWTRIVWPKRRDIERIRARMHDLWTP